jgi:putative ABC transport system permease protein
MNSLLQDLRYGARMLLKKPGFTVVAVVTLALGIGANTAIFSVLHAVLLRPLPYPDADRIVRIDETEGRGGMGISPPNLLDFQQQNHSFDHIAAYSGGSFILTGGQEPLRVQSAQVSHNLFSLLRVKPLLGRAFSAAEEKPGQNLVAIIGYGLWKRRFGGDPSLVERQIVLDDKGYLVAGIMPPDFEFPVQSDRVEVWVPLSFPADVSNLRGAHYLDVVGRLKPNISPAQAHMDLETIARRIAEQFPKFVPGKMLVIPLKQDLVGKVQPYLLMLAGAVLLVLLIATANVASLLLARAAARQKEIAVRMALGASRSRLMRQFLTESLVLSLLGGVGGILLAMWGTEILTAIGPDDVPRLEAARVGTPVLLFALLTSVVTSVLFGLAPAWQASTQDLHSTLKEGGGRRASPPQQLVRKMLVVAEVTLALVLLCGAGLLIKTMWRLHSVHPGFGPEKVVVAEVILPKTRYPEGTHQSAFFRQLIERIKTLPEVESAGGTTNLPLSGTNMVFLASVEGQPDSSFPASFRSISPDYFQTMRIPLLQGRWFDERDAASGASVVVINETMARRSWPGEDPLGKRTKHGFKDTVSTVVGVVGDVKYAGLDQQTKPELYAPFSQRPWGFMRIVARAKSDPASLAAAIRSQVRAIDKDQPVDKVTTMEAVVSASIAPRRFYMELLGIFAALALALATVGIYGIVSYSVAQRTQEIGIRVALGARGRDVLGLVLAEGLKLALLGVMLGLAGAFAATRVLTNLLFEVKPADPITFVAFSLLLAIVALLASYIPARRATKVDPMVALRCE